MQLGHSPAVKPSFTIIHPVAYDGFESRIPSGHSEQQVPQKFAEYFGEFFIVRNARKYAKVFD